MAADGLLRRIWEFVRELSGDDRYERYLAHQREAHPDEVPLSRKAFYSQSLERKWSKVSRCC